MEKQEIGIYGREKMFMRKKENELQIDWKHFYLGVLALVIPMALQNLINVGVTAPDVSPNKNNVIIYCTCPAREDPDSAVSPTRPSITTSAAVTPTLIRF